MNKKAKDFKVGQKFSLEMKQGKIIYTNHPDGDEVLVVLMDDGTIDKLNCNDIELIDKEELNHLRDQIVEKALLWAKEKPNYDAAEYHLYEAVSNYLAVK